MTIDEYIRAKPIPYRANQCRSESDGLVDHPIAIHDIHVYPIYSGIDSFFQSLTESGKIRRQNARSDFDDAPLA